MRTILFAITALLALPALAAGKDTKSPEKAIQATLDQVAEGFNKSDAKAVAAAFTEDATLINPAGMEAKGRAEVEKLIQHDLDTVLKGTTHSAFTIQDAHKVSGDAYFVDATHEATGGAHPMKIHLVALIVKKGGKWLAQAARPYAFMPPPAAAPPAAPPTAAPTH